MSDPSLDSIEVVMGNIQTEDNEITHRHGDEIDQNADWIKKNIVLHDAEIGDECDNGVDSQIDNSVREEIKAALMTGQKTITLSADDASLEAKILEIVRQSRQMEQGDGTQQQYIEIVNDDEGQMASRILNSETDETQGDGHRVMEIDLMNFKLVRYQDDGTEGDGLVMAENDDANGQQYIHLTNEEDGTNNDDDPVHYIQNTHSSSKSGIQYVQVIEKDKVPLVYFTTEQPKTQQPTVTTSTLSSRKRKRGEFVLPQEVINSPNFKLYLYNCKLCDFKCNAIKELTAHKAIHPGIGANRYRSLAKPPPAEPKPSNLISMSPVSTTLSNVRQYDVEYCTECDYKTVSKAHLSKHISKSHPHIKLRNIDDTVNASEPCSSKSNLTFYVCKKCNLKTDNKGLLKRHKCQDEDVQDFVLP